MRRILPSALGVTEGTADCVISPLVSRINPFQADSLGGGVYFRAWSMFFLTLLLAIMENTYTI